MSIVISGRLAERLRREAEERGMTPEELLVSLLTADLDPRGRAREYIEAALALLEEARRELERGNLRQASEKVWARPP